MSHPENMYDLLTIIWALAFGCWGSECLIPLVVVFLYSPIIGLSTQT